MDCSHIDCEKIATHIAQSNKGFFRGAVKYFCKKHARDLSEKGFLTAKIGQKLK